jgi:hypothetical protein
VIGKIKTGSKEKRVERSSKVKESGEVIGKKLESIERT